MNWSDRALRDWLRLLEKQDATIGGKPNPAAIEILSNIDLLLKTSPHIEEARFKTRFRWTVLFVATAALAFVMFSKCAHNSFALSATARTLSFTLDGPGEMRVFKELSVRRLVVSPVVALRTCEQGPNPLISRDLDQVGGTAVLSSNRMRVNSFPLPAGTQVTVSFPEGSGLRATIEYPHPLFVRLSGTASRNPGSSCDFQLDSQSSGLELTMELDDPDLSDPVDGQIPIRAVAFGMRAYDPGRSLSSVVTAMLSFTDIPGAKYALERGTRTSIDLRSGTLADFRVVKGDLQLLLQGDASTVQLGYRDLKDVTPTILDWLRSKAPNVELWMGLVYLLAFLFGIGVVGRKGG